MRQQEILAAMNNSFKTSSLRWWQPHCEPPLINCIGLVIPTLRDLFQVSIQPNPFFRCTTIAWYMIPSFIFNNKLPLFDCRSFLQLETRLRRSSKDKKLLVKIVKANNLGSQKGKTTYFYFTILRQNKTKILLNEKVATSCTASSKWTILPNVIKRQ